MKRGIVGRWIQVGTVFLVSSGTAFAQSASCERYRAELATLNRNVTTTRAFELSAERQRDEIQRLIGYYRSIGCERGFLFFGAPPECGPIAQRIRAMQATYSEFANRPAPDAAAFAARRQELEAAIAKTCDASIDAGEPPVTAGGTRLVCVRACDGYFFPLDNLPANGASAGAMCRALCPNAQVSVFRAPKDGGIERAVSLAGQPYMRLANALRYQNTYDPSCSCRKPGDSWAETLRTAERMIAHGRTDIRVTEKMADQLSRAQLTKVKATKRDARIESARSPAIAPATTPHPVPDPETTGSIASVSGGATEPEGAPRKIPRVIAPDLVPVPVLP